MKKKNHTIRDNVIAGLIYTLIAALIIAVINRFAPSILSPLRWVKDCIVAIWNHVTSPVSLPRWLIYSVALYILLRVLKVIRDLFGASREAPAPDYAQYTQDTFEGMVWRWRYTDDYSGIAELHLFCSKCDTVLTAESWVTYVYLRCDYCGQEYFPTGGSGRISLQSGWEGLENRVRKFIDRKIRNGEWKSDRGALEQRT